MGITEDISSQQRNIPVTGALTVSTSTAQNPFIRTPRTTSITKGKIEMLPVIDSGSRRASREDLTVLSRTDETFDFEPGSNTSQLQSDSDPRRRKSSTSRHLHLTRHNSPSSFVTHRVLSPPGDLSQLAAVDDVVFFAPNSDSPRRSNGGVPGMPSVAEEDAPVPDSPEVNRMRWRIKFFFMDPIEKWKTKHQFPWKLFLQVVKIIFVTIQLVTFGNERYRFATFLKQNTVAFRHLLLENWNDPDIPVSVYPNTGLYAVYLKEDFYKRTDYAVNNFRDIRNIAVGPYQYTGMNDTRLGFQYCKREFINAHLFPQNHSYVYDASIKETCLFIDLHELGPEPFSSKNYLDLRNESIGFDKLVDARLLFTVKSVALKPHDPDDDPACYIFDISILFDNTGYNGQIQIALDLNPHVVPCNGRVLFDDGESLMDILVEVLDAGVLIVCMVSLVLCLRALYNAEKLKASVLNFFAIQYDYVLSKDELMMFLNLWYVMIVTNDALIITGTILKMKINAATVTELPLYNACGMLLGVGNLLVWLGILRYFGFFKTYNILILTLKKAIPNVVRYLVCIMLIFFGFAFCGWIVLGPYHVKFQTFHSTTETIFSLINGDDMFATFAILAYQNSLIWYFSRLYLYTFICMFTYVVLSLMISLIMDAYGTVKDCHDVGGSSSRLEQFIREPVSGTFVDCLRQGRPSFSSVDSDEVKMPIGRFFGRMRRYFRRNRGRSDTGAIPHARLDESS